MDEPDFTQCPDWGKGGRYIYDPATGKRTRVDEAQATPEGSARPAEEIPGVVSEMAADPVAGEQLPGSNLPPVKEKRRG